MPSCVVKKCRNCSEKQKQGGSVSFHRFPLDPILRNKWTLILRQNRKDKNWQPSNYSVICSSHFNDDDLYSTKCGFRRICRTAFPTKKLNISDDAAPCSGAVSQDASVAAITGTTIIYPSSSSGSESRPDAANSCNNSPKHCSSAECVSIQEDVKDSEIVSVLDSPRQSSLKQQLRRLKRLKINTSRKLKTIQQKVRRNEKRYSRLKGILLELKKKYLSR